MSLSMDDATTLINRAFPDAVKITNPIDYNGLYIYQVFTDDPDEGGFDPFWSVNQTTGEIRDFSVLTDGDISDISKKFIAANP